MTIGPRFPILAIVGWLCFAVEITNAASRQDYTSLERFARQNGFASPHISGKQIQFTSRYHVLLFENDSRQAAYDGVHIWLNGPVRKRWGGWRILQADIDMTLVPLLRPNQAVAREGYQIVVLDPGHGGNDSGATGKRRGVLEKEIVLDIAKRVQSILRGYGVNAYLTRLKDHSMSLDDRVRKINASKADLLVSIHLNSDENTTASGVETHIVPPVGYPVTASATVTDRDGVTYPANQHDAANMVLGYTLQKTLMKYTRGDDRGVRRSRFYVIRNVSCPSALVECGFLSNLIDERNLSTGEYRETLARGLAEAILAYVNTVKRARMKPPPE